MGLRNLVLAVLTIPKIVDDERMAQQLGGGPPLYRLPLQAAINEVPKISGSRWRRLRRIRHTYRTHKASPISLPTDSKRKPSQIELQYTNPETPYIACGTGGTGRDSNRCSFFRDSCKRSSLPKTGKGPWSAPGSCSPQNRRS